MKHWNGLETEARYTVFNIPGVGSSMTTAGRQGHMPFMRGVTGFAFHRQSTDPMTPDRTLTRRTPRATARHAAPRPGNRELFRQALLLVVLATVAAIAFPLRAAEPQPRRGERPPGTPQAVGALHTVRTIPEACTRLEGMFTGDASAPYRLQPVPVGGTCQARARWIEPAQARPAEAEGWVFEDRIRIPAAGCPSQEAVVEVWHKPVEQPLARDGQGQVRIYLQDAQKQAAAGKMAPLPEFTARMKLAGKPCG